MPSEIIKLLRGLPEAIRQMAMRHKVLPWDVAENQPDKLLVVTPNPAEREIADVARSFQYKKFEICYMKERDWAEYWRQLTAERDTGATVGDAATDEEQIDLESILDRDISRGQLLGLLENLSSDAARVGATDIHIVPRAARKTEIYFRIDGQLTLWYSIEDVRTESVVSVVKSRGLNLDRYERQAAQEGTAQKTVDNQTIRFRVSVLPIVSRDVNSRFESVTLKVLRDASNVGGIDGLGLDSYSAQAFADVLERRKGLVIV